MLRQSRLATLRLPSTFLFIFAIAIWMMATLIKGFTLHHGSVLPLHHSSIMIRTTLKTVSTGQYSGSPRKTPFNLVPSMLFMSSSSGSGDGGGVQPLKEVLRFRGKVDTGYGRGGKKLGIPTANLPSRLFQNALEDVPAGVYLGWAVVEGGGSDPKAVKKVPRNVPNKAVVNVGIAPTFEGQEQPEKVIEAHLIIENNEDDNDNGGDEDEQKGKSEPSFDDFYGIPLRLQLTGFLRPEQKFDSFPALLAQIHSDIATAKAALDTEPYGDPLINDTFLQQQSDEGGVWIGSSGGNEEASWEFESFDAVLARVKK